MIDRNAILEGIKDKRGTLKRILSTECLLGRDNSQCPLAEWKERDSVELMTEGLVATLLKKHIECEV